MVLSRQNLHWAQPVHNVSSIMSTRDHELSSMQLVPSYERQTLPKRPRLDQDHRAFYDASMLSPREGNPFIEYPSPRAHHLAVVNRQGPIEDAEPSSHERATRIVPLPNPGSAPGKETIYAGSRISYPKPAPSSGRIVQLKAASTPKSKPSPAFETREPRTLRVDPGTLEISDDFEDSRGVMPRDPHAPLPPQAFRPSQPHEPRHARLVQLARRDKFPSSMEQTHEVESFGYGPVQDRSLSRLSPPLIRQLQKTIEPHSRAHDVRFKERAHPVDSPRLYDREAHGGMPQPIVLIRRAGDR